MEVGKVGAMMDEVLVRALKGCSQHGESLISHPSAAHPSLPAGSFLAVRSLLSTPPCGYFFSSNTFCLFNT